MQQLTQSFTDHSSSDCRQQHFEVLRSAWQLRPAMHAALRPALLSMLGDADPTIRGQALEFWDSALPKHVGLRLQALLQDSLTNAGLLVCTATFRFSCQILPCLLSVQKSCTHTDYHFQCELYVKCMSAQLHLGSSLQGKEERKIVPSLKCCSVQGAAFSAATSAVAPLLG